MTFFLLPILVGPLYEDLNDGVDTAVDNVEFDEIRRLAFKTLLFAFSLVRNADLRLPSLLYNQIYNIVFDVLTNFMKQHIKFKYFKTFITDKLLSLP